MDNVNVDVYPESTLEAWEKCHVNLDQFHQTIGWIYYRFLACPFGVSTAPGKYQARMAHKIL
jgi:hypothetical protein